VTGCDWGIKGNPTWISANAYGWSKNNIPKWY
jgi:hypothetical protein